MPDRESDATAGAPSMAFVSASDGWVQADIRENGVGNVKPGDRVEIALNMAPGKIFPGRVVSRGFAVKHASGGAVGEAATVKGDSGWLRDARRYPLRGRQCQRLSACPHPSQGRPEAAVFTLFAIHCG